VSIEVTSAQARADGELEPALITNLYPIQRTYMDTAKIDDQLRLGIGGKIEEWVQGINPMGEPIIYSLTVTRSPFQTRAIVEPSDAPFKKKNNGPGRPLSIAPVVLSPRPILPRPTLALTTDADHWSNLECSLLNHRVPQRHCVRSY